MQCVVDIPPHLTYVATLPCETRMTEKPTKFTVFQKTKLMHFLFSHFSAVDLASTEHCCNSHHLLLLLYPQTELTCVQVLKFRLKPSLNGRRSGAFEADNDNQHLSSLC